MCGYVFGNVYDYFEELKRTQESLKQTANGEVTERKSCDGEKI